MKIRAAWVLALWLLLSLAGAAVAQSAAPGRAAPPVVELVLGPATVPLSGAYTIAFRLRGAPLGRYSAFPELEGFRKSGKTSTTTTRIVDGRSFSELTITQRYLPYGEGEQLIRPFQMTVNGQTVRSAGATVRVGPAPGTAPPPPAGLPPATAAPAPDGDLQAVGDLDQLFGKPKASLYQDVPDHAFLAVVPERSQVYVGEGVKVGLYFYLLPADQELLAFHDFSNQLPRLFQQLHQATAWEVPAAPASEKPDTVRRNGQLFLRFRLTEAYYYPLTAVPLQFPALALTMTKFRLLHKPEPGVDPKLATYKTYQTAAVQVQVQPLPPHPLRDQVPVGDYQLREGISRTRFRVGQAFVYSFGVEGRGNLASLMPPAVATRPALEVYGPETREQPALGGGSKVFRYRLVARRPGVLPLDSLLQIIVFNPRTAHYDTLRPELRPEVRGVAAAPVRQMARPTDDPFYGPALAGADSELQDFDVYRQVQRYAAALLLALAALAVSGVVISWRKSAQH